MTSSFYTPGETPTTDWLLMHYAAGALPPYESMLIAAYLAVNAAAQSRLAAYEAEGGRMIEETEPVSVTHGCLNSILAIIEPAGAKAAPHPASSAARTEDCPLPAAVRRLLTKHCPQQKIAWRPASAGIARLDIHLCHSEPRRRRLSLLHVEPGRATPSHNHSGLEMTLVLKGSYHDEGRRYQTGDLVILQSGTQPHSPTAGDEGCICMVFTEAPPRFQNPLVHILSLFR